MNKNLFLSCIAIMLFLFCTITKADEFDDAVKVCNSFKKMNQIIDCELETPRIIQITINTNPTEAKKICRGTSEMIVKIAPSLKNWTMTVWNSYSRRPIAKCQIY
jgi:hypothetical protein